MRLPSLLFFAALIACFVFFFSTSALAQEQQFSTYTDPEGRFTIDYPSDWHVNEEQSDNKDSVVQFDSSNEPDLGPTEDICENRSPAK